MDNRFSIVEMIWILNEDSSIDKIGKRTIFVDRKTKSIGWLNDGRVVNKIKGKWCYQAK